MKTPPYYLMSSFLAFSGAKNMLEAAESIGLSQPALTNHLKLFEEYFPQDVFAFEGRKKVLTPFGQKLRQVLESRFRHLDQDLSSLGQEFQKPEDVVLKIAGRAEILNLIADKLEFPGTLIFVQTDGKRATEGLLEREFDIAISNHMAKASQLFGKSFFTDGFSVTFPLSWKVRGGSLKTVLESLVAQPFLAYKERDENLDLLLKHFKIETKPSFKKVLSDWTKLNAMVEKGQGWTISPDRYISSESVAKIKVTGNLISESNFYYLYRKEVLKLDWYKDFLGQIGRVLK